MTTFVNSLFNSMTNFTTATDFNHGTPQPSVGPGKEKLHLTGLRQQQQQIHQNTWKDRLGANLQHHEEDDEQEEERLKKRSQKILEMSPIQPCLSEIDTTATFNDGSPTLTRADSRRLSEYPSPWPTYSTALDSPTLSRSAFQEKIAIIIDDLFVSEDAEDCSFGVRTLGCPSFHDILARDVIAAALDKGEKHFPRVYSFLRDLFSSGSMSETQLLRSLHSISSSMKEFELDRPNIDYLLYTLVQGFINEDVLDQEVFSQFPEQILCAGNAEPHLTNVRVFKRQMKPSLEMYFHTMDFTVISGALHRINMPQCQHEFVKMACHVAFDRNKRERELLPRLFFDATNSALLTAGDLQLGLSAVIGSIDDMSLDWPNARNYVTDLLTHLVLDELLSADLLHRQLRLGFGGPTGRDIYETVLRRTPEHSRKVWGDGDYNHLMNEMQNTITEYLDSYDCQEVGTILGELHLSKDLELLFLKTLLVECLARQQVGPGIRLTAYLLDVFWTKSDIAEALELIREDSSDLVLDMPNLRGETSHLINELTLYKLVDPGFRYMDKFDEV